MAISASASAAATCSARVAAPGVSECRQTLSMDVNESGRLLRDDLYDVCKKSGVTQEKVVLGSLQPLGKNGVKTLSCTVTGEGWLQQMVQLR